MGKGGGEGIARERECHETGEGGEKKIERVKRHV